MPATERYQVDFFAILVLIIAVLIMVFLIITAIYFYHLMNLRPPTTGESTFLFWTAIILSVIFLALAIYALIRIFTHTAIVYEAPPLVTTTTVAAAPAPIPITVSPKTTTVITRPLPPTRSPPGPPINVIPQTAPPSDYSVSYSSVPLTRQQSRALNQQVIDLGGIMSDP
jgi:hypothetical protein